MLARMAARLLLLGVSLFVVMLFVEVILRVTGMSPASMTPLNTFHRSDPEVGWVGVPSFRSRFKTLNFDVVVETNGEGFRRVDSTVEPAPEAPEIWLFGDSFAWGWGVDNGALWSDHLQGHLGPECRVVNYGVNAYGTVQQCLLLRRRLEMRPAPSDGVFLVCVNDFADNLSDRGGVRPFLQQQESGGWAIANTPVRREIGGWLVSLRRHSQAVAFFSYWGDLVTQLQRRRDLRENWDVSRDKIERTPAGREEEPLPREERESMEFIVGEIAALCRARGIRATFVMIPQATARHVKTAPALALGEICANSGVRFIDLAPDMIENRPTLYIGNGDNHWTAEGHRQAAELIAREFP